jgi:histone-lysine N-methyltransferase EZH2
VGDVIKDEEAKVKGIEYDKVDRNYLFEISSDYCVDGLRKGNKTRFMNHSPKPNVNAKMTSVNGDPRIAFYTKKEIPAETEVGSLLLDSVFCPLSVLLPKLLVRVYLLSLQAVF